MFSTVISLSLFPFISLPFFHALLCSLYIILESLSFSISVSVTLLLTFTLFSLPLFCSFVFALFFHIFYYLFPFFLLSLFVYLFSSHLFFFLFSYLSFSFLSLSLLFFSLFFSPIFPYPFFTSFLFLPISNFSLFSFSFLSSSPFFSSSSLLQWASATLDSSRGISYCKSDAHTNLQGAPSQNCHLVVQQTLRQKRALWWRITNRLLQVGLRERPWEAEERRRRTSQGLNMAITRNHPTEARVIACITRRERGTRCRVAIGWSWRWQMAEDAEAGGGGGEGWATEDVEDVAL